MSGVAQHGSCKAMHPPPLPDRLCLVWRGLREASSSDPLTMSEGLTMTLAEGLTMTLTMTQNTQETPSASSASAGVARNSS